MKKSLLILSILLLNIAISFGKKWTVVSEVNYSFNPSTLTITLGDTVVFNINAIHDVQEVSKTTWDANDSTPLPGGFSLPNGGGKLTGIPVGTHYYVCTHHVGMHGMKGTITVNPGSGIETISGLDNKSFSIYPNPSKGNFRINFTVNQKTSTEISLIDLTGKTVKTIVSQEQAPGNYQVDMENKDLYGLYFIRVTEKSNVVTRKVIIL